jgi:hypothetical protein
MMRTFALLALLFAAAGCKHPGEGERCNPMLFTDQCGTLSCVYPQGCGVAFCCPVDADGGVVPNTTLTCQPCPTDDASTSD